MSSLLLNIGPIKSPKANEFVKVVLIKRHAPDGSEYWSLTFGRAYEVLGIECDWFRLLDDRGEPVLFDPACFRVVETNEPANWLSTVEDGCRYAYPLEWNRPGFFEDWHDGVRQIREAFWRQLQDWHAETAHERRIEP